jgi:ribonuclease T1
MSRGLQLPRTRAQWIVTILVGLLVVVGWWLQQRDTTTSQPTDTPRPTSSIGTTTDATDATDPSSPAPAGTDPSSGLPWVAVDDLPAEAAETLELIDAGGPFPYDRDGIAFGNREGILPDERHGYYHEYTVPTPGEDDRGARRIVTGASDEYYWTEDHYDSFERISR